MSKEFKCCDFNLVKINNKYKSRDLNYSKILK